MGKFLNKPNYEQSGNGKFKLLSDLDYINFEGKCINILAGFETDGYSKPNFWIIDKFFGGNYQDDIRPAVIHDWRCVEKNCTEKYASTEFLQAMLDVGIDERKAKWMHKAVRMFQMTQKGWQKDKK